MFDGWSIVQSSISAAAGLGGVWLGATLTGKREEKREKERVAKESSYLAILVVAHLDRLANQCMHVALDDGTAEGRPAGDGSETYEATVQTPTIEPLSLEVDWKVLPPSLMYGILNLQSRIEQLENRIAGTLEFDDPPEYTEFFWARRFGFAELGLAVSDLAKELRQHAGLPIAALKEGEWSRDECMREQVIKISQARAARDARRSTGFPAIHSVETLTCGSEQF